MTLREKQSKFVLNVTKLITYIYTCGYEVTFGEAYAIPCLKCGWFGHLLSGKHPKRLAIDLNLFKDGKYLSETEDHKKFGEYWKELGGIWGGDFENRDGNHYEL